jgi:hypothetical protein
MQKPVKSIIGLLLFSFLTLSCVTTRLIRYETVIREPKPANYPVDIYESSNLNRRYKIIGIVTANAGKFHSPADTLEYLKNAARKMGGAALMDLGFASSDGRIIQKTDSGYISGSVRENWGAKVIVWENNDKRPS